MTPERIDELMALAALGELTSADEVELQAATTADPALAAELDELLAAASTLQRVHAEEPPAGLRSGVLAAISSTPQEGQPDSAAERAEAPVVSLQEASTRRRRFVPAVLAAAAAVVFVIGAFIVSNEASAPDEFAAVVDASDAQVHSLAGETLGSLTVTYSPSHDAMVLQGEGIATLSADETYQLWFDIDGHMTPAGLFRPDDDGSVEERIEVPDGTGTSINVTEEPVGGSEVPTLPVLASTA